MPVLFRACFGYLLRHPWQLALAIVGICIGVAVIVAVDLANTSSRRAFLMSMDAVNGEATHQIVAGPSGLDESIYTKLRVEGGIRPLAPVVAGYIRHNETILRLLGVDLFAEREFRAYTVPGGTERSVVGTLAGSESAISVGRQLLTTPGAVLASARTAQVLGVAVDDKFDIVASGKHFNAHLVGALGDNEGARLDNIIIADIASAQEWLDMQGRLTRIDVRVREGNETMLARIRQVLPRDVLLLSASGRTQATLDMTRAFMTNLTAMSLLALLVGIFLIYNSVSFAVLQRRGLIGVLRALGLTRAETLTLILVEAIMLGLAGAFVGLIFGIWLGEHLLALVSRTISDHYFVVNVTHVAIAPGSISKGVVVGLGATLLAALLPAIEASSYRPRLALARSVLESKTSRTLPVIAIAGLSAVGLAALIVAFSRTSLVAGLVALFLLILGIAMLIPIGVRTSSAVLAPAAARVFGTIGRLAVSGVGASLSRTGVAIVALSIAVSATVGVSVMVDSFRVSVNDWLRNTLQSDIYVGVDGGLLDQELLADVLAIPGIDSHTTTRRTWLETDKGRIRLVVLQKATDRNPGTIIREGDPDEVWQQFEAGGAVLVSDAFAYRYRVTRGDTVRLPTRNGDRAFRIAAVYQSYDSNDGAILMSRRNYDIFFDDPGINSLGLYLEEGEDVDRVMNEIRQRSAGRQALLVSSNARIRDISLGIFDRTFVITDVLYWLAVGVAIIGILGAMLALQLERAKEMAVLRAIGFTPGQMGSLVTVQSGFIGILSGVAAIPIGLVMAWVLIAIINRRAFGWQIEMMVEPTVLLTATALAVVAALAAGIYPAWRAARARPALAMREE